MYTLDTNAIIYYLKNDPEVAPFLQSLLDDPTIPIYVSTIARAAGRIRGTYRLKLADSFIATTALFTGSTLLTRNVRDFKNILPLSVRKI